MPQVRARALAVGALLLLAGSTGSAKEPPALEPLAFLVGEWPSSGAGQPGATSGKAIRYAVEVPTPGHAVFLSEPAAGQPRFRLGYALDSAGALEGEFAIAPPGAPDAFKPYLTWKSRKATTPGS